MQCRYVGDVGDFGKYGLLRALCTSDFNLGIIWYLADKEHNNDGRHINYLYDANPQAKSLKECDPDLYRKLKEIVTDTRCVKKISEAGILPNTTFFEKLLSFKDEDSVFVPKPQRKQFRKKWADDALIKISKCNIIFVDPDTGINLNNDCAYRKKGPKYIFFTELGKFRSEELTFSENRSLVIYHHLNRRGTADSQIENLLIKIRKEVDCFNPFALRYHRGPARAFFIVPGSIRDSKLLSQKADEFLQRGWNKHFTRYPK